MLDTCGWRCAWLVALLAVGPRERTAAAHGSAPASQPRPATDAAAPQPATGFLYRSLQMGEESFAYCIFVPPEYTPQRPWPLVLFLHGSLARGTDGLRPTDEGLGRLLRRNRALCPAIVVMPQCRPNQWWEGQMLELALRCAVQASTEYRVDHERVYVTGISMGGAGTWLLAARFPLAFAAAAPICGFLGRPDRPADEALLKREAASLAQIPIWAFHGALDRAVPVARSRELVGAVRAAGGEARYTEIPDGGHEIWDQVYDDPAFWRWLLAQRRPAPQTGPASAPAP